MPRQTRSSAYPLRLARNMNQNAEPLEIPITGVFDLHTVQPKEVEAVTEAYLAEAHRLGLKTVRIIHGRGTGVQCAAVRAVLARTPFVLSFHDAPPSAGGWGATSVSLRPPPPSDANQSDPTGLPHTPWQPPLS